MMKILFICTHNRCRSILSEAICNHLSDDRLQAFSAGSQPAGEVHPLTLKYLAARDISTQGLHSKSWDDFAIAGITLAVTVCDNAANEVCPVWFENTLKVHWGLPDPSKLTGNADEIEDAFFEVMDVIESRITKLLELDYERLDPGLLKQALENIS